MVEVAQVDELEVQPRRPDPGVLPDALSHLIRRATQADQAELIDLAAHGRRTPAHLSIVSSTTDGLGNGEHQRSAARRVPSRIPLVSRARADSVVHASVGPGRPSREPIVR
jgi:hypothetical protein